MNKNLSISISDLNVASVLMTLGYKLLETDKTDPRRVIFVFENNKDIQKVINDYFNDDIKLPAQTLLNNQKLLKNRIWSTDV
ncbi:MAG: DUF5659 domain-containing protein [Candidatus Staskawiczbacteria bacterium]|nr:DUF5659 domain-containing protein [Candidatus Staskawiczbacteria bacterium]